MRRLYITLALLTAVVILSLAWWVRGNAAANPNDNSPKIFVIEKGQGVRTIARNLKDQGLIKDQVVFFLLTKKLGLDQKIQAGSFRLNPGMRASEIANQLTVGTLDVWVTVPEGQRAGEIGDILEKTMPNYDPSWEAALGKNEGFLFPDTYLFPKDSTVETIIKIMTANFEEKYKTLDTSKVDFSKEEITTIASLIEREARHDEDRPLVSSVIHNRLGLGMKLDVDATLQYVLGYQKDQKRWWKEGLTDQDKLIRSPYNTYQVAGLPPGPISNPGLLSLEAAVNPAQTDYLYYITDSTGTNRYAKTFEQHQENIEKYGL
ncbi:MAG: endolytic transglycosylase MltG [Candidatus Levybacteria bacterium]|nr:endolytic transglycosylase MltG [Candidatus Levybacteria bacterium]